MMMFCAARDGVDAAFLLQTVLRSGVDVNGVDTQRCAAGQRPRGRREGCGGAEAECEE